MSDNTNQDDISIPVDLAGCRVHFRHRLPTQEQAVVFNTRRYSMESIFIL
jgi:hypothetical protein